MITTIIAFLKTLITIPLIGLHVQLWIPILFVTGATVEYFLGRSKNPKYRSIAGTLFNGLRKLAEFAHADKLPIVSQILDFIAPPAVEACKACNGTGVEPPKV